MIKVSVCLADVLKLAKSMIDLYKAIKGQEKDSVFSIRLDMVGAVANGFKIIIQLSLWLFKL